MTENRATKDGGLTLVELLVALAVLGLLGGLAATGLRSAAQGWRQIAQHNAESEELQSLSRELRRLLSQAYPAKNGSSPRSPVRFIGYPDRIELLAPLAQRFGAEDVVKYSLRFPGDGTLRVSWRLDRPYLLEEERSALVVNEEVISGFSESGFSYFGQSADGEILQWWSSWKERPALPRLVRVRFVWRGHAEELIAAPLLTAGPCSIGGLDVACSD